MGDLLRFVVLGFTPFERPDPRLAAAVARAGAFAILDLGRNTHAGRASLMRLERERIAFGVRVPERSDWTNDDLPARAELVVLDSSAGVSAWRPRSVLVEVTSLREARAAIAAGADGFIVKGCESGGRIGDETSFVLLQRVAHESSLPIWVRGGVGLHSAAACVAGGATGV